MNNKFIVYVFSILIVTSSAFAQYNATGLGFGNNYRPYASGVDAFKLNPSRLAYNNHIEFTFISLKTAVSNSSFAISNLNQYFSDEGHHGYWSVQEKKDVLELVNNLGVQTDIGFNVFSLVYNNMGFGIDVIVNGGLNVSTGKIAKVALFGTDLTTDYSIKDKSFGQGSFFSAVRYSFAYAHLVKKRFYPLDLKDISVGGKLSYYQGIAVAQVLDSDANIKRSSSDGTLDNAVVEYRLNGRVRTVIPDNSIFNGSGIGLDLAASATFDDHWHFSLILENPIGIINWYGNPEITKITMYDSTYITNKNDDGVDRSVDLDTTRSTGNFITHLPASLYLGAHYQLLKNLALTAQYKQGLSENFGNTYTPQLGVGAEYHPVYWLPLRMGMTVGGRNTFILGLGTGVDLNTFQFNISYAMREGLWPTYSNGAYIAWDFKIVL